MRPIRTFLLATTLVISVSCDSEPPKQQPETSGASQTADQEVQEPQTPEVDDATLPFRAVGPVAKVNGQDVDAEDFNSAARRFGKMAKYLDSKAIEQYRERIMQQLIRDEITDQKLQEAKVTVEDSAVDEKFGKYLEENFHTEEDIREYYRRTGMSPELIKDDIRKSLTLEKYLREKYETAISDEEVKAYYEENQQRFQAPEQVKGAHILLRVSRNAPEEELKEKKKDALKIARAARKSGADFAALARKHSEGPRADKGGDLGWFARKEMVPEFSNAAFRLEPGGVSDPVRSSHGFHVIKVYEKRPERVKPFEEAGPEIRESLERARMRDATVKFMKDVRESAKIERIEQNIVKNPDFVSKPPSFGGRIAEGLQTPPGVGESDGNGNVDPEPEEPSEQEEEE